MWWNLYIYISYPLYYILYKRPSIIYYDSNHIFNFWRLCVSERKSAFLKMEARFCKWKCVSEKWNCVPEIDIGEIRVKFEEIRHRRILGSIWISLDCNHS